jgi:DNA primase
MAGLIPQSFIDDLVSRADIVEIIDARVPLKKAGRDHKACCPFHDEKSPSFTVSQSKQFFHCFGCGAHGTVIGFLMDFDGLEFVEAIEELAQRYGIEVPREAGTAVDPAKQQQNREILEVLTKANLWYQRKLREHPKASEYLKARGLSGKTAALFEIGFVPEGWDHLSKALNTKSDKAIHTAMLAAGLSNERDSGDGYDRFRNRIMFPIHDRRGQVVGFGGRVLDDSTPKYLNSPETPVFHKGRELYGLHQMHQMRIRPQRLLVVEGYMDVVMLAEHGIHYACATLGTAATADHMDRLFREASDVVFCFDGDEAGRRAAWRALENALPSMRDGRQASFMHLPQGEDPDSYVQTEGQAGFEDAMAAAPSLSVYLFEQLRADINLRTGDGRARLIELAQPFINKLPQGAFRNLCVSRLAELTHQDTHQVAPAPQHSSPSGPSRPGSRPPRRADPRAVVTPVRRAITLLIQHTELANQAQGLEPLRELTIPGVEFLVELLEALKDQPHLTTGGVIEKFRDHPQGRFLERLAGTESSPWNEALHNEFEACLELLRRESVESRFQELRERERDGRLSGDERIEFLELIRQQREQAQ